MIDDFIANNIVLHSCNAKEKYVLYIGRLENIKGVQTLIDAVKDTDINLKIIGTGEEEEELKKISIGYDNIEFLGFRNKNDVFKLTMEALFIVCPSICYENLPFSIIESFLFSKPVIGAEIGGIPELIIDGKTGLLFEAGNAAHLCEKMNYLWNNENIVANFGKAAREHVYKMVNFNTHWNKLQEVLFKLT